MVFCSLLFALKLSNYVSPLNASAVQMLGCSRWLKVGGVVIWIPLHS